MTNSTGLFIFTYVVIVNLWAFTAMGIDKSKAKKHAWRISEKALFLPVILGGAPGGIIGMHFFRHKTRHWYFRFGFPAIFLAELILIGWFILK